MNLPGHSVEDFEALPCRIFLDSNILQILQDYGAYVWDNDKDSIFGRITKMRNGVENLESLRRIFLLNERANFEFALSSNSMKEVQASGDFRYLQWAYDVLDRWMACIREYNRSRAFSGEGQRLLDKLDLKAFEYLSKKDRALVIDAVKLECDAFLTMDMRLASHAPHIRKSVGIQVLQPSEYWQLLSPWAGLWF